MVGDKDGEGECGREGELGEGGREGLGVNAGMGQQRGTEDGLLPQKGLRKFSFRATFERRWLLANVRSKATDLDRHATMLVNFLVQYLDYTTCTPAFMVKY